MFKTAPQPPLPSNQKFGWLFALVCAVGAAYAYAKGYPLRVAVLAVFAAAFAGVTVLAPGLLAPLNRIWYRFGLLLGKIVSPVVLGAIFFLVITPVSLATRLFGRDPLRLKPRQAASYWIDRTPPGPAAESFKNQF